MDSVARARTRGISIKRAAPTPRGARLRRTPAQAWGPWEAVLGRIGGCCVVDGWGRAGVATLERQAKPVQGGSLAHNLWVARLNLSEGIYHRPPGREAWRYSGA